MREFLVPILGEWGAIVAQFLITVVIVFGLIGLIWWFVRRYSGVHFGGIGRGRVPRLAVVDALAVDRRRRLVLVRRDNVEHLLLIGGPSDVVVEGAIHRTRQRSAQAAAQAAAARAALQPANEPPPAIAPDASRPENGAPQRAANEPIPFPLARAVQAHANSRAPLRPAPQPAPPAEAVVEPEPATPPSATNTDAPAHDRQAAVPPLEEPPQEPPPQEPPQQRREAPAAESLLPEVMTAETEPVPPSPPAETAAPAPTTFAEAELEAAEEARQAALDLGEGEAPATAPEPEEPAFAAPDETGTAPAKGANRVGDLEREMARLLDEITTRRSS